MFKYLLLMFGGASFGLVAAAGVFTVFSAAYMVPRYAGKYRTAKEIILYENMVIVGTIIGSAIQMYVPLFRIGGYLRENFGELPESWRVVSIIMQIFMGVFYGIFVGTLALSIAEMLDSIPIFFRRIRLKNGVSVIIAAIAIGKLLGSLLYFYYGFAEQLPQYGI